MYIYIGGVYFSTRKILPFSFLDTISSVKPSNFGIMQPNGIEKIDIWWNNIWPKLVRVGLRGMIASSIAGFSYPLICCSVNKILK